MANKPLDCHPTQTQHQQMIFGTKEEMSKKLRKLEQGFMWQEGKKMKEEDRLSEQCGSSSSGMSTRPAPQYRMGQSVLHFWASWMSGATKLPRSISKKNRPRWYSAEILSPPTWREEGAVYGGCPAVGWGYKVF
jgi:hypothetical protein